MIGSKDFTTPIEIKKEQIKPKSRKYYFLIPVIILVIIFVMISRGGHKDLPIITPYQFTKELINEIDRQQGTVDSGRYDNSYTLYNSDTSQRYLNIEFYENPSVAYERYTQLEAINEYIHEIDDSSQFAQFLSHVESPYFISDAYVEKNIVMVIDASISKDIQQQFINAFQKVLKKYTVVQSEYDVLKIESLSADIIKERFLQIMQKVDDRLRIQMLNHEIDQKTIEQDIIYLKDIPLFEKYYQRWNQYAELLKSHSFEGSEIQKILQKELKEKVYKEGEYIVGQDMIAGYYIAVSQNHPQMESIYQKYSWRQDTIFYLKDDQKVSVSKDILLYSLENSPKLNTEGYTSGVFKVGQHIEPGTYELSAQSHYPCDYWIINQDELTDFLDRIQNKYHSLKYQKVKNDQTQIITLKENQYLFLNEGKLEKK